MNSYYFIEKTNKKNSMSFFTKTAVFLLIVKTFLASTSVVTQLEYADLALTLISSFLFFAEMIYHKYSYRLFFVYIILLCLCFISYARIGSFGIMLTIITLMALRRENINSIYTYIFKLELFMFALTVILSIIDFFVFGTSISIAGNGVQRYKFGFVHPNVFSAFAFNLIMLWVWINYKKINLLKFLMLLAIEILCYLFSRTRTTIFVELIMDLLLILPIKNKLLCRTSKIITPLMAGITFVLAILYINGNGIALIIDNLLSSRIKLTAYAIDKFGLTLFGNNLTNFQVKWEAKWGLNTFTFDNLYSLFFSSYGIVWLIVYAFFFYRLSCDANKKVCIFIILWALYGMTETHGINCYMCCPTLLVILLFQKKSKKILLSS